nr:PAS domain S-box protein [Rhabdothermincola salaria]
MTAIETAESLIVVTDAGGSILWANPACERILGWSVDELVGRSALDFMACDELDEVLDEHLSFLDSAEPRRQIRRWRTRDGGERSISFTRTGVRDDTGVVRRVVATGVDVTAEHVARAALLASERRHRALVEHASDVVVVIDDRAVITYVSASAETQLGWTPSELEGRSGFDLVAEQDRELALRSFDETLSELGPTVPRELRIEDRFGRPVLMEVVANNRLQDPSVEGVILHMRDITERRSLEVTLSTAQERFRQAFAKAPTGIALVDLDGRFLEANRALADILGREPADLSHLSFQDITHPDDLGADLDYLDRLLSGRIPGYRMEKRYLRPDATVVWCLLNVSVLRDAEGAPQHLLAHVEDITSRKSLTEELAHLAHHDGLTGLPNRTAVHTRVGESLARRHLHEVGVLFLDLDGFKDVNDTYGHDIGDRVLSVVARRLADAVRPTDLVGRVGGDEFVVVCEPASATILQSIAERIGTALERPIELAGLPAITTGATVGLAVADPVDDTASLLRRADEEMYRGKAGRRPPTRRPDPPRAGPTAGSPARPTAPRVWARTSA